MPKIEGVEWIMAPCAIPDCEVFCPFMSLPVALGCKDADVPKYGAQWLGEINPVLSVPETTRKKVGIVWAGSPDQDNDHHRSSTLEDFLTLYEANNVQLYSFQVGDKAKDARNMNPMVIDLSNKLRDFRDTAHLMMQMDHIVTVCTSTAHLAGSLGLDTHIVLPRHGQHFVWGYKSDKTDWYPTATLYRQDTIGDWTSPLKRVASQLNEGN
jgi:hypothetical protein